MLNFFKNKSSTLKNLGQLGEEFAQKEYQKHGFKIIATNEFNKKGKRLGEIDFIATNNKVIIFVEVKTRSLDILKFGAGVEAVDFRKQQKLLKAVKVYLINNPKFQDFRPQIDVCVVEFNQVDKNFVSAKIISNAVEDSN